MTVITSDNRYGVAQLIVAPTIAEGANYTTIASALTAASSGQTIFIRPGTYTENITLKAGVNLSAFDCDALTPNVTIVGKCTFTAAGTVSISGIRLQTNSDYFLAVTGTAASIVNLKDCYLNISNNTGIQHSTTSSSSEIFILNCRGDIGTTGIALFAKDNAGVIRIYNLYLTNSGGSSTDSTCSAGSFEILNSKIFNSINTSGTAGFTIMFSYFFSSAVVNLTANGSGSSLMRYTYLQNNGSFACISVGASCNLQASDCSINTGQDPAITGAGTLSYTNLGMSVNNSNINTTTQGAGYTQQGKYRAMGQPAFLAFNSATDSNVTGDGTTYTIICDSEVFDQDSNYNTGTGVFTAPVTGRYDFTGKVFVNGGTNISSAQLNLVTSNRSYKLGDASAQPTTTSVNRLITALTDMDAADTCSITITCSDSGGKVDDVYGEATDLWTYFCGKLCC